MGAHAIGQLALGRLSRLESTALGLAESSVIKHRDRRASPRLRSARVVAIREFAMADAQEPPRLEGK